MVVVVIDNIGITINKFEKNPPVAGCFYSILIFFVSRQLVEIRTGIIHIFYFIRSIKPIKNPFQSVSMLRVYAFFIASIEEVFQAFMFE